MKRWFVAAGAVLALAAGSIYRSARGRRFLKRRVPYEYL